MYRNGILRRLRILLLALAFPLLGFTSSASLDSLLTELNGLPDSIRCESLVARADALSETAAKLAHLQAAGRIAEAGACHSCQKEVYKRTSEIYLQMEEPDSAHAVYLRMKAFSEQTHDSSYLAVSLNNLGVHYKLLGQHQEAISYFIAAAQTSRSIRDSSRTASALKNMGATHIVLGEYEKALPLLLQARLIWERLGKARRVAGASITIGNLYSAQGDHQMALQSYREAQKIALQVEDVRKIALTWTNIGNTHYRTGAEDSALAAYAQALAISREKAYKYGTAIALYNLGNLHQEMEQADSAQLYYEEAVELAAALKSRQLEAYLLQATAVYQYRQGNLDRAIGDLKASLVMGEEMGDLELLREDNKWLSEVYGVQGDFEKAYAAHLKYITYKDSMFNAENIRRTAEARAQFELERARLEDLRESEARNARLLILEKETQFERALIFALSLGLLLVLFAALLILNRHKQQRKILAQEKALSDMQLRTTTLEKEHLEAESALLESQRSQLSQSLEFKSRELSSFALNIVEKMNLIKDLRSTIQELRKGSGKEARERLGMIDEKLRMSLDQEKDNALFEMKVDRAHEEFFLRLAERYPQLSQKEKRLAAFLRLDFSSKEIASMFNIEAKSVDMGRYRLRKKLGIPQGQNLVTFLLEI